MRTIFFETRSAVLKAYEVQNSIPSMNRLHNNIYFDYDLLLDSSLAHRVFSPDITSQIKEMEIFFGANTEFESFKKKVEKERLKGRNENSFRKFHQNVEKHISDFRIMRDLYHAKKLGLI